MELYFKDKDVVVVNGFTIACVDTKHISLMNIQAVKVLIYENKIHNCHKQKKLMEDKLLQQKKQNEEKNDHEERTGKAEKRN